MNTIVLGVIQDNLSLKSQIQYVQYNDDFLFTTERKKLSLMFIEKIYALLKFENQTRIIYKPEEHDDNETGIEEERNEDSDDSETK